jgi:OmpA-OmpF porin, OOP family
VVRSILSLLIAAGVMAPAVAEDKPSKLYASLDVGNARNGVSDYVLGTELPGADRESTAFRVRGGYQFMRFFAMEAGYVDLGSYRADVHLDCSSAPYIFCGPDFSATTDLHAWHVSAVATYSFDDRLNVRAQMGWMWRTAKTRFTPVSADAYSTSDGQLLPTFGVGVGFSITPHLETYAEWNKFVGDDPEFGVSSVSDGGTISDESDIEAFSLGVRWRF